ncbi:MAG: hypothetical protein EOM23_00210 [Candidatus Moranbacteria bacterium]|nr:hypothetical protein [Candidatus Moranbacteria bacterium]
MSQTTTNPEWCSEFAIKIWHQAWGRQKLKILTGPPDLPFFGPERHRGGCEYVGIYSPGKIGEEIKLRIA